MSTDFPANGLQIANAAQQMGEAVQKPTVKAPKKNVFQKALSSLGDFFHSHFTKMGRLELKEKHAVTKINTTADKLAEMENIVKNLMEQPQILSDNESEAKKIFAKYNRLLKTHEKATQALGIIRNKFKEIDKAKHGYERVQSALISIENESKVEAHRENGEGLDTYKRLHNSLIALRTEYPEVFKKHPELQKQYAAIAAQQIKIVVRASLEKNQIQAEMLKTELKTIERQKEKLTNKAQTLADQKNKSTTRLNKLSTDKKQQQNEIDRLTGALANTKSQIESHHQNVRQHNELQKQYDIKKGEYDLVDGKIKSKAPFVYKKNLETLGEELNNLHIRTHDLSTQINNNTDAFAKLQDTLKFQSHIKSCFETALANSTKEIEETEKQLKKISTKEKLVNEDLTYFDSELQIKNKEFAKLQTEIKDLKSQLQSKEAQDLKKQTKMNEMQEVYAQIRESLQNAEQQGIEIKSEDMQKAKALVEKLENEYAAL